MDQPKLYLLLGLPGSGKTTTARTLATLTGAVHLSSDNFRLSLFENPTFSQDEHDSLYKMLDYMCELLLKNGTSVIYDANLNRYIHRKEKYDLAKKLHVPTELFLISVPKHTAKHRRVSTQHPKLVPHNENPHDMFDRIADVFEAPKKTEKYTELDGTKITPEYVTTFL